MCVCWGVGGGGIQSLWWMHFAIGNFIDNISDRLFSCTLQVMNEKVTVKQKCLFSSFYPVKFISVLNVSLLETTLCHQRGTLHTRVMLKPKYVDNPGAKTKCTALTFSLNSLYIFRKISQPKVHVDVTISCYRTIIPPRQNIQTKFYICSVILVYFRSDSVCH